MPVPVTASKIRNRNRGFSLLELVVSIGMLGILVLAASSLLTSISKSQQALKSQINAGELQNLITLLLTVKSSASGTGVTGPLTGNAQCGQQLRAASLVATAFTLSPQPAPGVNIPSTPISFWNGNTNKPFLIDGQVQDGTLYSAQLSGVWSRTLPSNAINPNRMERYLATLTIITTPVGAVANSALASARPKPTVIPLTLDLDAAAGTISSCSVLSQADNLAGATHSAFDCINTGGDLAYNQSGQMLCKFSMHFIAGSPSVICPAFFKASGGNCVPDPATIPIAGCPTVGAGAGSFCARNGAAISPNLNACGTYTTTVFAGRGGRRTVIHPLTPAPAEDGVFCTYATLTAPQACVSPFAVYETVSGGGRTHQRCAISAANLPCTSPFVAKWVAIPGFGSTWACYYTPSTCEAPGTSCLSGNCPPPPAPISTNPLICPPLVQYHCTGAGSCLTCPTGWTEVTSQYSGTVYEAGVKIVENITCQ